MRLKVPDGATIADVREYIDDAVSAWKGQLQPPGFGPGGPDPNEPGDPLFDLDRDSIKVRHVRKRGVR